MNNQSIPKYKVSIPKSKDKDKRQYIKGQRQRQKTLTHTHVYKECKYQVVKVQQYRLQHKMIPNTHSHASLDVNTPRCMYFTSVYGMGYL